MNYTEAAFDRIDNLFSEDREKIWADILSSPDMDEPVKWAQKFESIAQEYMLSSRFALMRLCQKWATKSEDPEAEGFTVTVNGNDVQFSEVTVEKARNLGQAELQNYFDLLLDRSGCRSGMPDYDQIKSLIKKALKDNTVLTREEAFLLGHTLRFSLDDMQWFLLRTREEESGFQFNTSNDLIEAYGFVTEADARHVSEIKNKYQEKTNAIPKVKVEDKIPGRTLSAETIPDFRMWTLEERDSKFLEWMLNQAAYLDLPSLSALTVYRNLAALAYKRIYIPAEVQDGEEAEEVFFDDIEKILAKKPSSFVEDIGEMLADHAQMLAERAETDPDYKDKSEKIKSLFCSFQEADRVSYEVCGHIADELTIANQNYELDKQTDLRKRFRTIKMKKGQISTQGGIDGGKRSVQSIEQGDVFTDSEHITEILRSKNDKEVDISRERIENLLYGDLNVINERAIDKPDILYMLWLTAMLYWADDPRTEKTNAETAEVWFKTFVNAAQLCLNTAMLPDFYPPHLLEQSMMLSLVRASETAQDPTLVYEHLCDALTKKRVSKKAKQKNQAKSIKKTDKPEKRQAKKGV